MMRPSKLSGGGKSPVGRSFSLVLPDPGFHSVKSQGFSKQKCFVMAPMYSSGEFLGELVRPA